MDYSMILTTVLTGVFGIGTALVTQRVWFARAEAERARLIERIDELNKVIDSLTAQLFQLSKESREADTQLKEAALCEARDRINQGHRYFMGLGKIDKTSYDSLSKLHDIYVILGGNSFVAKEWEQINSLPIVDSLIENSK